MRITPKVVGKVLGKVVGKVLGLALLAGLALGLAGCTQPNVRVIPRSEPSAKPVFASDADALAAAKAAYVAYLKVAGQVIDDGGANPSRAHSVVTPTEYRVEAAEFKQFRTNRWHGTGEIQISSISLQGYFPTHESGIVSVYVCLDISETNVLNSAGQSVVSPNRPSVQAIQAGFDLVGLRPVKLKLASNEPWAGGGVCS